MKYLIIGKKGIEAGFLVVTLLTIISFIFIAGTVQRVLSDSDEKQAERTCHDSIALRAAMTIRVNDKEFAPPTPPLCKTIDKKIKGDKEKIMQQFSDKMARCWWMFGEGRYEQILDDPKFGLNFKLLIEKALGIPKSGNECFICYTMSIDEDEIKGGIDEGTVTARDLAKYLAETDYKKVKEKKYLDYIQNYGGPGSVAVLDDIKARNTYGITFFSKNQKSSGSYWAAVGTAVGGTVAVAGALACVILEPCGLIAGGAVLGGTIIGGAAVGAGGAATAIKAYRDLLGSDERDVSIIAVDDLKTVESYGCVQDIAGE